VHHRSGRYSSRFYQCAALAAGVGEEHAQLTVLHPPRGAGVLPLHAGRLDALLQEAGLVHDQHTVVGGQVLGHVAAQVVADRVGVPSVLVQQPLHPVRRVVAGRFRDRPTILASQR